METKVHSGNTLRFAFAPQEVLSSFSKLFQGQDKMGTLPSTTSPSTLTTALLRSSVTLRTTHAATHRTTATSLTGCSTRVPPSPEALGRPVITPLAPGLDTTCTLSHQPHGGRDTKLA